MPGVACRQRRHTAREALWRPCLRLGQHLVAKQYIHQLTGQVGLPSPQELEEIGFKQHSPEGTALLYIGVACCQWGAQLPHEIEKSGILGTKFPCQLLP